MAKYRKKPVVVEAWHHGEKLPDWLIEATLSGTVRTQFYGGYMISTLEGDMYANENDYIIRGVRGELYPCKPDVFQMTYEEVQE